MELIYAPVKKKEIPFINKAQICRSLPINSIRIWNTATQSISTEMIPLSEKKRPPNYVQATLFIYLFSIRFNSFKCHSREKIIIIMMRINWFLLAGIGFIQSGLTIFDTFFRLLSLLLNDADLLEGCQCIKRPLSRTRTPNISNLGRSERSTFQFQVTRFFLDVIHVK